VLFDVGRRSDDRQEGDPTTRRTHDHKEEEEEEEEESDEVGSLIGVDWGSWSRRSDRLMLVGGQIGSEPLQSDNKKPVPKGSELHLQGGWKLRVMRSC